MPQTRKLPSGRFQARYIDKTGKLRTAGTFARAGDAEEAAKRQERKIRDDEWTDPARRRTTFDEWAPDWFATKSDLRPSSRARLEGILSTHVLKAFGDRRLSSIGNAEVREWVTGMVAAGSSPGTARKAYSALNQMMRAAVADRRITFNPCQDVPLPSARANEQRFLSREQINLLADCIDPRFRALVLVAAYGGLRFGELGGLRRKRVDVLRGRVRVQETLTDVNGRLDVGEPKTKRSLRTVPLPRSIMRELEAHLVSYPEPGADALVFTGHKGAPLRRSGFRRLWWQPSTKAAGLEGLKVHELRHTFVALWVDAGAKSRKCRCERATRPWRSRWTTTAISTRTDPTPWRSVSTTC